MVRRLVLAIVLRQETEVTLVSHPGGGGLGSCYRNWIKFRLVSDFTFLAAVIVVVVIAVVK